MQTWQENYNWHGREAVSRRGIQKSSDKTQPTVGPNKSTDMQANILDSAGKTNKKEGDQNCDAVTRNIQKVKLKNWSRKRTRESARGRSNQSRRGYKKQSKEKDREGASVKRIRWNGLNAEMDESAATTWVCEGDSTRHSTTGTTALSKLEFEF